MQSGQQPMPKGQGMENSRTAETAVTRGGEERPAEGQAGTGKGAAMPAGGESEEPSAANLRQGQPKAATGGPSGSTGENPQGADNASALRQGTGAAELSQERGAGEGANTAGKLSDAKPGEKAAPQNAAGNPSDNGTSPRSEAAMPRPMLQNTPQTMETMKQMATLLLRDASLSEGDTRLLQNFVNNQSGLLSEKDAKQLQLLLRLCQSHIPASVQQAAQQQNLPDLPKLWAFMQLCDLAYLKEKDNAASLKKASRDVAEFASMMKGAMASENSQATEGQRSMSLMVPLYMGDQEKTAFPAYIHVYDETEDDPASPGERKKETWLRVCLLTENIGAVDLTFRMYEKRNLDVRVLFSEPKMIKAFGEYIPEFEQSFTDTPLVLKDLKVALAGDPNG